MFALSLFQINTTGPWLYIKNTTLCVNFWLADKPRLLFMFQRFISHVISAEKWNWNKTMSTKQCANFVFSSVSVFTRATMLVRYLLSSCVRLSVRLSQVGVLLKQLNLGSRKQRHSIAQQLQYYPRDAMLTQYLPSSCVCLSVRPPVCLSICLSQVGVLPRWLNLGWCEQRCVIAQGL